jgi:hypothetical protein
MNVRLQTFNLKRDCRLSVPCTKSAAATAATVMCDRWEDADDDIKPLGKQGRVARLGIAGFVACAVAGEHQQQQQQQNGSDRIVIVDSKRVSYSTTNLALEHTAFISLKMSASHAGISIAGATCTS